MGLSAGSVPGQSWSAVSAKRAELEGKRATAHMATPVNDFLTARGDTASCRKIKFKCSLLVIDFTKHNVQLLKGVLE